jgi:hypothetical protein
MVVPRRRFLESIGIAVGGLAAGTLRTSAAGRVVSTLVGTGVGGYSDQQINNPFGLVIGPDKALYFCDLDNQRIRRFDVATRRMTTIAGNGERGHQGDGGPATSASLNMPHEQFDRAGHIYIAGRDSHVVRKVEARTGSRPSPGPVPRVSQETVGGTRGLLRQPQHVIDSDGSLLICDIETSGSPAAARHRHHRYVRRHKRAEGPTRLRERPCEPQG